MDLIVRSVSLVLLLYQTRQSTPFPDSDVKAELSFKIKEQKLTIITEPVIQ